jgi:pRiA4b ORF-3-like protein
MKVAYRFRIALRHIGPKIRRRVELAAESPPADLQRVIQIMLDWSDEYQPRFCIRKHFLGASRPGGLLLCGDREAQCECRRLTGPSRHARRWCEGSLDYDFRAAFADDHTRCHRVAG